MLVRQKFVLKQKGARAVGKFTSLLSEKEE